MRRVEEEMRKRERVEEEKRKAEEVREKEQENEQLNELQIEKDEKYVYMSTYYYMINTIVIINTFVYIMLIFRISEMEFVKLAEQLNSRLQVDPAHESVDLDNLFAFLSDVQSGRSVDTVGDHMKEIVSDFDEVICTQQFLPISSYIMWFMLKYFLFVGFCQKQ